MFNTILALVMAAISLSASTYSAKVGDEVNFSAQVTGPFEGQVCVVWQTNHSGIIDGAYCPEDLSNIKVEDGVTSNFELTLEASEAATYTMAGVLASDNEPVFSLKSIEVVVSPNSN